MWELFKFSDQVLMIQPLWAEWLLKEMSKEALTQW